MTLQIHVLYTPHRYRWSKFHGFSMGCVFFFVYFVTLRHLDFVWSSIYLHTRNTLRITSRLFVGFTSSWIERKRFVAQQKNENAKYLSDADSIRVSPSIFNNQYSYKPILVSEKRVEAFAVSVANCYYTPRISYQRQSVCLPAIRPD